MTVVEAATLITSLATLLTAAGGLIRSCQSYKINREIMDELKNQRR